MYLVTEGSQEGKNLTWNFFSQDCKMQCCVSELVLRIKNLKDSANHLAESSWLPNLAARWKAVSPAVVRHLKWMEVQIKNALKISTLPLSADRCNGVNIVINCSAGFKILCDMFWTQMKVFIFHNEIYVTIFKNKRISVTILSNHEGGVVIFFSQL